jgi:hypothetical protein
VGLASPSRQSLRSWRQQALRMRLRELAASRQRHSNPTVTGADLKSRGFRIIVAVIMSEPSANCLSGTALLAAGIAMSLYRDDLAAADQRAGASLNAWLKKRLGESFLTRDIYSVSTESGLQRSKVTFRVVGIVLCLCGTALVILSLLEFLRLIPAI